jgi:putative transposase
MQRLPITVNPKDTSKTCVRCGYVKEDLTLVDRDYNAALNVLRLAGWMPALAPVKLHPIPINYGHGGIVKQEAPDFSRE